MERTQTDLLSSETRKNETVEGTVKSALNQMEGKKYETELLEKGINNFKKPAVVFKGKKVTVTEG